MTQEYRFRIFYKHEDTPNGESFCKTVLGQDAFHAVARLLADKSVCCPCCAPITVSSVEQCVYGKHKEVPEPKGGWDGKHSHTQKEWEQAERELYKEMK